MNLTTSKAKIVKIDNNPYHSFNAYKRPARVKSAYRLNPNARVINLDPTDDPNEVCNAYRQVAIKSQLATAMKHKRRFAEEHAAAQLMKEQAESMAKIKAMKRAAAQLAYRQKSSSAVRRKEIVARMENKGFLLFSDQVSSRNSTSLDICTIRQTEGIDIVTITSVGVLKSDGKIAVSAWGIDNFKRPAKALYSEKQMTKRHDLKVFISSLLSAGYLIQANHINATARLLRTAIADLRKEGVIVCTVRNSETDEHARGWLVPSEQNGMTEGYFFTMDDFKK